MREVFLVYMIEAYSLVKVANTVPTCIKMEKALARKDISTFIKLSNSMFANIPSQIWDGTSEKYFHSLIHLLLNYMGIHLESEINTNKGRLGAVIQTPHFIYILEFKFNKSAQIDLDDIASRNYTDKFLYPDKKLICVGINFSSSIKGIDGWLVSEKEK